MLLKITLFIISFTLSYTYVGANTLNNIFSYNYYGQIEDGWYNATVKYTNYKTGTNSTYSLKVEVKYGKVSQIDFGNGGSVHSGYNNEGYIYSGGYLSYETDRNGNIIAARTTVTISDSDGLKYFKVTIE